VFEANVVVKASIGFVVHKPLEKAGMAVGNAVGATAGVGSFVGEDSVYGTLNMAAGYWHDVISVYLCRKM